MVFEEEKEEEDFVNTRFTVWDLSLV